MSRSMRRRDFLIAAGVAGTALAVPSVGAFAAAQAETPDPDFHVYLAFGQSNMEGFPGIEAQDKEGVDPRFREVADGSDRRDPRRGGLRQPGSQERRVAPRDSTAVPLIDRTLSRRLLRSHDGGALA